MDGMFTLKELESNPSPSLHEATILTTKTHNQEDITSSPNRAYLGWLFIKALFSTKLFLAQLHRTNIKSWFLMKKELAEAGNEPRPVQSWGNQPTTELNQEEDVLSKLAFFRFASFRDLTRIFFRMTMILHFGRFWIKLKRTKNNNATNINYKKIHGWEAWLSG